MALDKMKKRKYAFEEYDPEWILLFSEIRETLQRIFGTKALDIQHVGSTSIPGMKAKPLIDVLVTVKEMEPFASEKKHMEDLGYEWGADYIEPDSLIFFKTIDGDQKIENIHVCVEGSPQAVRFITTRDYLRAHPERAEAYGDLKQQLNKQFPEDYPAYREGKQAFLEETARLSKEWAENKQSDKACVFCSIPEIKARTIAENDLAWAFPTNIPITEGHTLVSPKRCVKTLGELTSEEKLAIFELSETIMNALRAAYGAEGFNCAWNQEKLAGQSVPHFHLHIIPRKEGDSGLYGYDPRSMLYRTGDRDPVDESELSAVQQVIKTALS